MIKLDRNVIAGAIGVYKLKLETEKADLLKSLEELENLGFKDDVKASQDLLNDIDFRLAEIETFLSNFPSGMIDYEFYAKKINNV